MAETLTGRAPTSPLDIYIRNSSAATASLVQMVDSSTSGNAVIQKLQINTSEDGGTYKIGTWYDITIGGNATNVHPIYMYLGNIDGKTISNYTGIYMYVEDIGGSVSNFACLGLETNIESGNNASEHCFIRLREHDTVNSGVSAIRFEGGNAVDLLFDIDNPNAGFADNGTTAGDQCVGHLKLQLGTSPGTCYINVFSDNS